MSLSIKYWGVRGSLPSSKTPQGWCAHIEGVLKHFFNSGCKEASDIQKFIENYELPNLGGYGTATTCVEVSTTKQQLIIDGGSGIRILSEKMMSGTTHTSTRGPFHIFMTHFHWDHLIGLPFFTPHFMPGANIHYYGVQKDLEKLIRGVFQKPYFPVPYEALAAKVHFHVLQPYKPIQLGNMTITPYQLDHPDPCWGYKIVCQDKVYSHCVDTEGTRVSQEELGPDLPLYQGVDLMYFDAQYTFPELAEKANWGHSAAQIGLDIAFREGVKQVLFAHHDPGASIQQINEIRQQTMEYYNWRLQHAKQSNEPISEVKWDFAYDGLEVIL